MRVGVDYEKTAMAPMSLSLIDVLDRRLQVLETRKTKTEGYKRIDRTPPLPWISDYRYALTFTVGLGLYFLSR